MYVHVGNSHRSAMRHFAFNVEAGLLHPGCLEIVREGRDVRLFKLRQTRRQLAIRRSHRAIHQRVGILGKYLVIEKIVVVQKEEISSQPVIALNCGSVDLRNASLEEAKTGTNDQRPLVPERVCQPHARTDIGGVVGRPATADSTANPLSQKFAGRNAHLG